MTSEITKQLGLVDFVERVALDAPRRDTERILFTDLKEEMRDLRLGALRLPHQNNRERLPLADFFEVVLDLATADSNLAHSLRNHFSSLENNVLEPGRHTSWILDRAAEGSLFFGAAQESTGSAGSVDGEPARFEAQGNGTYLLTTRKFYATGSMYADYLSLGAILGDTPKWVLIEADRPGIELPDDWGGFGQRLTGSGSVILNDVRITEDDFVERGWGKEDSERYPFTFNQVYLTTTVAGIAQRALTDAIALVRNRSRNYYHGTADRVEDEVVVQAVIGVASAKAFAAKSTILTAARLLEYSFENPDDLDASLEATLAASKAKITVEALTVDVIDSLTQVASGSTLSTERALDRHWRNLKVLASHNPTIYKHRILGEYELSGTKPPVGVYF